MDPPSSEAPSSESKQALSAADLEEIKVSEHIDAILTHGAALIGYIMKEKFLQVLRSIRSKMATQKKKGPSETNEQLRW